MTSPVRVMLVGAGGQVGRYLLDYMGTDPRMQVGGICRNAVTAGPLRLAGFDITAGQVGDPEAARELLGDADVIVNLSAASGTATVAESRAQNQAVLRSILGLPGRRRIIHFSSVGVYGTCPITDRNTFDRPRPDWPYGKAKLRLEHYLRGLPDARRHEVFILRLGHVYGVAQWVSRVVLTSFRIPARRLPFDGKLPSNAVHVRNVAVAMRRLVLEGHDPGTWNLVDSPPSSWREVFDWNTDAVGGPRVPSMAESEAKRWREHFRLAAGRSVRRKAVQESARWLKSLPVDFVMKVPSFRATGADILDALRLERVAARAQVQMMNRIRYSDVPVPGSTLKPESVLFSDPVPGPVLQYSGERGPADAEAVARWYRQFSSPDSLLDWS